MPIILGTKNKLLSFKKAYLGDVLKYEKITEDAFDSPIVPTAWTAVTTGTKYTAINKYGLWQISATSYKSNVVSNAFDGNESSYWQGTTSDAATIQLECPCLINPKNIYLKHGYYKNTSKVEGYDGTSWETLFTLQNSYISYTNEDVKTENIAVSTEKFYSKFRISGVLGMTLNYLKLYEFQITSGIAK